MLQEKREKKKRGFFFTKEGGQKEIGEGLVAKVIVHKNVEDDLESPVGVVPETGLLGFDEQWTNDVKSGLEENPKQFHERVGEHFALPL